MDSKIVVLGRVVLLLPLENFMYSILISKINQVTCIKDRKETILEFQLM